MASTLLPRINPFTPRICSTPFRLSRPTCYTRVCISRYSTKPDEVIKVKQIPVLGSSSGHVRVLLLNRPSARNAISRQLLQTLSQNVKAIAAEEGNGPTRALVVASNVDAAFCAGADLKERAKMSHAETEEFLLNLRSTFKNLANLQIPTISAISSTALGGGLELALCTHLRVFSSTSTVGLPETRLAIIPGAGGTYRLPALIGMNRARDLILTGRRVSGPEAYFLGLCDRLVDVLPEELAREKVLDEAIRLALEICDGGPVAVKQALLAIEGSPLGEVSENRAYEGVIETEDRYEALQAFAEKRKPVFKGR